MTSVSIQPTPGFAPGDLLVDPRHGVVVVEGFETRPHAGKPLAYVRLRAVNGLTILLPKDDLAHVRVRPPIEPEQVAGILSVLSQPADPVPPMRQREFALLRRRVESGDLHEVAAVLRDLVAKEQQRRRLGNTEKKLLDGATQILASEIALVLRMSVERATARIVEALGEGS